MTRFSVPEMTCGHCKKTIEDALHKLDAQADVTVNLDGHEIAVTSTAATDRVIATLKDAGYDATVI